MCFVAIVLALRRNSQLMRPLKPMTSEQRKEFRDPNDEETRYDVRERLNEGRGAIGQVSPELMKAIAADRRAKEQRTK